ncbi:MAG: sugar-binding domain-containing protein [Psychroserpens sp.]|uniref:sugar-binding domain-containing protein n=1 Tax=Psychroserpens sp. TaxID=2020870 RepID=UPI003C712D19
MTPKLLLYVIFLLFTSCVISQNDLLINTYNRETRSLNGSWNYIIDPYESGYYNYRRVPYDTQEQPWKNAFFLNSKPENKSDLVEYNFDNNDSLLVPGDWNTQKKELLYYEGSLWYKKSFDYNLDKKAKRLFIYFEASNYKTEVYLNGKKLGTHIGGFTPFNFDITNLVEKENNHIIVKVDNKRTKEGVPTLNTDWWNYGGLTRDVKLIETNETFIQDYMIQLDPNDSKKINGFITLKGKDKSKKKVTITIPELGISKNIKTNDSGEATFEIPSETINYWSDKKPKLYDVTISLDDTKLND